MDPSVGWLIKKKRERNQKRESCRNDNGEVGVWYDDLVRDVCQLEDA